MRGADLGRLKTLGLKPPYDLAVTPGTSRPHVPGAALHETSRDLPLGSLVRIAPNTLVSSPELCFLQLAHRHLALPHLVLLGYELCGSYVLRGDSKGGFTNCPGLSEVGLLRNLVAEAEGYPGCKLARRALAYIADGAASPAESQLAALLSLPTNVGGYGFAVPQLNVRVELSSEAQAEAMRGHFRCDLLWPDSKVAVEYNGAWHYDAREQRDSDVVRSNILADLGISVAVVTAPQLYDADAFDAFAKRLAHRLGRRLRIRATGFDDLRRRTHEELTKSNPTF